MDTDHSALPIPDRPCNHTKSGTHFCLEITWEALDPDHSQQRRGLEVKLILEANRKAIKNQLNVSFEMADKEHALYFNRTVATDCSDGRVTGYFPGPAPGKAYPTFTTSWGGAPAHPLGTGVPAYMGDAAVVNFDSVTGLVACASTGPLVIPPCYDMSDYSKINHKYTNPFVSPSRQVPGWSGYRTFHSFESLAGAKPICDGTAAWPDVKGRCPETPGSGTTAIAYFDSYTGISQCSNPNILVEKVVETDVNKNCDDDNKFGVVKIRTRDESGGSVGTFQCSTHRFGTTKGGVVPYYSGYPCTTNQAIKGFSSTGGVSGCVDGRPTQTAVPSRGFRGPQGQDGQSGALRWSLGDTGGSGPKGNDGRNVSCSGIDGIDISHGGHTYETDCNSC